MQTQTDSLGAAPMPLSLNFIFSNRFFFFPNRSIENQVIFFVGFLVAPKTDAGSTQQSVSVLVSVISFSLKKTQIRSYPSSRSAIINQEPHFTK